MFWALEFLELPLFYQEIIENPNKRKVNSAYEFFNVAKQHHIAELVFMIDWLGRK